MMTAVSIILLELGSVVDIAAGAAALIAALVPAVFFLRDEPHVGRMVYGATSALSILIVPDKFTALVYTLVLGLYTVVKCTFNWQKRRTRLLCKGALLGFWILLSAGVIRLGLVEDLVSLSPTVLALLAAGWTLFLLYYDFCMTRIFIGMRRGLRRFR